MVMLSNIFRRKWWIFFSTKTTRKLFPLHGQAFGLCNRCKFTSSAITVSKLTVLLSKMSFYLCKGMRYIPQVCPPGPALTQKFQLQSADSSTGQSWNKFCLLHGWRVGGGSLVAKILTMENWNTDLLKSKDWVLKHDLRGETEIELIYFLNTPVEQKKHSKWAEWDKKDMNSKIKNWRGSKHL